MLNGMSSRFKEWSAKRKFDQYEKRYRLDDPLAIRPAPFAVEEVFDEFVREFGGTKVSQLITAKSRMPFNADYLFKEQNVLAELKTLEGVFCGPEGIASFIQAFVDRGYDRDAALSVLFGDADMPEDAGKLIRTRLRRALEQRVKHARKQLRFSKSQFGNSDTKSLILMAVDQTPLFTHKVNLMLLAQLMDNNYSDEHVDGVVYFNPNTPTKMSAEGMEFSGWFPFYRDDAVNKDLSSFVNLLASGWLKYAGNRQNQTNPILELDSVEGMFSILGKG